MSITSSRVTCMTINYMRINPPRMFAHRDPVCPSWLGESLSPLEKIPAYAISLLLSLLVATFTECASNTATTTLFLPILGSMVNSTQ